jgi:hypothetical protein
VLVGPPSTLSNSAMAQHQTRHPATIFSRDAVST